MRQGKSAEGPSPKPGTTTRPKARRATYKRIPISGDISELYFGLGRQLEHTPQYPAGRMLTYQAPGAGVILDEALAGTLLDRMVIQPIWRSKDKWEDVLFLGAPPVLLFMMQNIRLRQQAALNAGDQQEAQRLQGALEAEGRTLAWMLRSSLVRLAPAVAEAKRRAEEEDQIIREAFPELPPGDDPVMALISSLFTPPAGVPMTPTEEAEHVHTS